MSKSEQIVDVDVYGSEEKSKRKLKVRKENHI